MTVTWLWAPAFGFDFVAKGNVRGSIRAHLTQLTNNFNGAIRVVWQELNQGIQSQFYVRIFGCGKTGVGEELQIWLGEQGIGCFNESSGTNPSDEFNSGWSGSL